MTLKKTLQFTLFLLINTFIFQLSGKTIYVYNKKQEAVQGVKISPIYKPYDSLQTSVITDNMGKVEIPSSFNSGLYFLHPNYNSVFLDGFALEDNDTIYLSVSYMSQLISIKSKRFDHSKGVLPTAQTEKDIEKQNPGTAADLLNNTGEVYVQKSQLGGGSPMIRGFSANGVLLVIDGVRMNNAIYRSGNLQNIISIDPYYLENANVIFGPGSLTYGSDALGGVMDFNTKGENWNRDTAFKVNGSLLGKYGTAANEKTGHLDFNIYNDKLSLTTSFSYSSFDDLKMGNKDAKEFLRNKYVSRNFGTDVEVINQDPLVQVGSGFDNYQFLQKLAYKASETIILNYGLYYSNTTNIPRYDRLILEDNNSILSNAEWNYGPQKWVMNRFGIQYKEENKLFDQIDVVLAFQDYTESRIQRKFGDNLRSEREEKVNVTTFNVDFEKDFIGDIDLYYGIEMVSNLISSIGIEKDINTGATSSISTRYPDNSNWNSEALYIMSRKNYDSSSIFGGLRVNFVQIEGKIDTSFYKFPITNIKNNLANLTASLGYSKKIKKEWSFYTTLSSAFRAPNMDDIGKIFDSEPGSLVIPNPELKPETVYNFDFTIGKKVKKEFKFQTSVFASYLTNAMVRKNTTLNGADSVLYEGSMSAVSHLTNSESATIYGIQLVAEKRISKKLYGGGTVNYMQGKTSEKDAVRHVSPAFGKVYLKWASPKFTSEINAFANGSVEYENLAPSERNKPYLYSTDSDGNPYSKSWYTLNFLVNYYPNMDFVINGAIENIMNQAYRPYSSGIAAPGRNYVISLKYKF